MGFIVGQTFTIKTIQPFHGPVVVELNGVEYMFGRGMFKKIKYEKNESI